MSVCVCVIAGPRLGCRAVPPSHRNGQPNGWVRRVVFGAGLDADGDGHYARHCCDDGCGRHRGRVDDGGECEYDARGLETLTSKIEDGL